MSRLQINLGGSYTHAVGQLPHHAHLAIECKSKKNHDLPAPAIKSHPSSERHTPDHHHSEVEKQ